MFIWGSFGFIRVHSGSPAHSGSLSFGLIVIGTLLGRRIALCMGGARVEFVQLASTLLTSSPPD